MNPEPWKLWNMDEKWLHSQIKKDITTAANENKMWSKFRPFVGDWEKTGAKKCAKCKKPPTQVSYCTSYLARNVACDKHAK